MVELSTQKVTPEKPLRVGPFADHMPDELKQTPQWVLWKPVPDPKSGKLKKVPLSVETGQPCDITDPSNLFDFDAARRAWKAQEGKVGLGFVFTDEDDFVGIDLDKCIDPQSGALSEWAWECVKNLNTYGEISPSGTGLHLIARCKVDLPWKRKNQVEVYRSKRYFTMTGLDITGQPIRECGQELLILMEKMKADDKPTPEPPKSGLSDTDLIACIKASGQREKFQALWRGDTRAYASHSEADLGLCAILAFWTAKDMHRMDRLFRQSGLMREKWDRKTDDVTYGRLTLTKAIDTCKVFAVDPVNPATADMNALCRLGWPSVLSPRAQSVYSALIALEEKNGTWPGQRLCASYTEIAKRCRVGKNSVPTALDELQQHALVDWKVGVSKPSEHKASEIYRLVPILPHISKD